MAATLQLLQGMRWTSRQVIKQTRTCRMYSVDAQPKTLNWPDYLAHRMSRRRWEIGARIPCLLLGLGGGLAYFGSVETDAKTPLIMGFDPLLMYGLATIGCGGLGYLAGPTVGAACWRLSRRNSLALIEARDREFHHHIVKNRVDPRAEVGTLANVNALPDFYGEKIGSLHQYRQWLRDQTKCRKKGSWLQE